jgi:hypothetical protein
MVSHLPSSYGYGTFTLTDLNIKNFNSKLFSVTKGKQHAAVASTGDNF